MTQVAGALDAAHARGLVHRDVKPSNILLAPAAGGAGEYCYLCDFGLIKEMHSDTDAETATDQLVGSVPYVAPEQVEGDAVDGRTDVYSLGCAIFHCLAGSPPYQGQTDVEVVFAHLRGEPPPLSGRVAGLPPALDRVLARAMARDKQDRYLTCSALVAAAADLLAPRGRVRAPLVDDDTRSMDRPRPPATVVGPPTPAQHPPDRPAPAGGARPAAAAGRRLPGRGAADGADRGDAAAIHAGPARNHHRPGHRLRLDRAGDGHPRPAGTAGRHARPARGQRPVRRRRHAPVHRSGLKRWYLTSSPL
jgi:serine/threonine-protein kinase